MLYNRLHCTTPCHSTWDSELKSRLARRTRFNPTYLQGGGRASVTSRPRQCSCSACGQPSSSSCSCGWTSASWSGSWTSSEWGTICFLPSFWFLRFASFCAVRSKFFSYLPWDLPVVAKYPEFCLWLAWVAQFFSRFLVTCEVGLSGERFSKLFSEFVCSSEVFPRLRLSCKVFFPVWGCLTRRWILIWMAEVFFVRIFACVVLPEAAFYFTC